MGEIAILEVSTFWEITHSEQEPPQVQRLCTSYCLAFVFLAFILSSCLLVSLNRSQLRYFSEAHLLLTSAFPLLPSRHG